MLSRVVAVVGAFALSSGFAYAEELTPEQARAFVVGKLFSYTCFDGTAGMGRIFGDGSVVGTIRPSGQGPIRFAALPAGTVKVSSASVCAHVNGLMFEPCFRVQKTDAHSFRGSLAALSFAYCDFTQHNPRTQLTSNDPVMHAQASAIAAPRATPAPAVRAPVTPVTSAPSAPIVSSSAAPAAAPVASTSANAAHDVPAVAVTPAAPVTTGSTAGPSLRPAIED